MINRTSSAQIWMLCLAYVWAMPAQLPAVEASPSASVIRIPDVQFIPTPHDVVNEMLELAALGKNDILYDLGCGDGRIVVAAARRYGCRAVGVDIDPLRISEARENVRNSGLGNLVRIEQRDLFGVDLSVASVVIIYLSPRYNVRLIPQFKKLKPGSRIVSHLFDVRGVPPDKVVQVLSKEDGKRHTLFLWITPLRFHQ